MISVHTCKFVRASEVFANFDDIMEEIYALDKFTWGDAEHTLIATSRIRDMLSKNNDIDKDRLNKFFDLLDEIEREADYIDFET